MPATNVHLDLTANGLYVDDKGRLVSTHSMVKTMRRCPKQAQYKYVQRLKPRVLGRPLRCGTWMHKLQEVHYLGGDWRKEHQKLTYKYRELWDEEKVAIGDLPTDCKRLMESYLWHYKDDNWKVLETEFVLEAELPDGSIFRGRVDNLIENEYGLWIVDHKWHKTFPDHSYRILDAQSAGYLWLALKNGIPVQGHIWNYGKSKPPTMPTFTQTGLIARWDRMDTDYLTAARWIRDNKPKNVQRYLPKLKVLQSQRYRPGEPQTSQFFRRVVVEKNTGMINRAMREMYHTHKNMHAYPFGDNTSVERVPDRSCTFMCSYHELCGSELITGKRPVDFRRRFRVGDPMDYYNDDRKDEEDGK